MHSQEEGFDVVHISAHGGESAMYVYNSEGSEQMLLYRELADVLGENIKGTLRAVILNCCSRSTHDVNGPQSSDSSNMTLDPPRLTGIVAAKSFRSIYSQLL